MRTTVNLERGVDPPIWHLICHTHAPSSPSYLYLTPNAIETFQQFPRSKISTHPATPAFQGCGDPPQGTAWSTSQNYAALVQVKRHNPYNRNIHRHGEVFLYFSTSATGAEKFTEFRRKLGAHF